MQLGGSVGSGGMNRSDDVRAVQTALNGVPPEWGGPARKLTVDGACGPKTLAAISGFQQFQLGTVFTPDGRIDPGRRTVDRLDHIASSSARPGAAMRVSVEPVSHVPQPSTMVCWAAAGTMLVAARERASHTIESVMARADAADPGYGYLAMFKANRGLPPADTTRYTRALGLRVQPPVNFDVRGWRQLLATRGAVGVVGLTPFLHIRVVSELQGDGTVFGTLVTVHDPGRTQAYKEVFVTFAQRYESAAFIDSRMDQVWHQ